MATQTDDLLARLIEHVEGRYYGKYRGHVTDHDDPDNLGRIKATVPRLLGSAETGWALPAFPYGGAHEEGFFALPDIDAGVWIEFEGGDLSYPIWSGTWYKPGDRPESAGPGKKVFKTTSGHKIILDDDGSEIVITHSNGNTVTMDETSILVQVSAGIKAVVDAPLIELVQDASHPLVFGDQLLEYLIELVVMMQAHIHPGELAAGVIPVTPAPPVIPFPVPTPAMLSLRVTTE